MRNITETGMSPSNIRQNNKQLLLNLLRRQERTIPEISEVLKLSPTAVNNIALELRKSKVIVNNGTKSRNSAGRRAAVLSLNPRYGMVIMVEFASSYEKNFYRIIACNVCEHILALRKIPPITGDTVTLTHNILKNIDDILTDKAVKGLPLLNICIAAPGIIDDETGLLIATSLKKNDEEYNLKETVQQRYRVPVHVRSLLSSASKAELSKGGFSEGCKFGILFNMDSGIGMSFIVNNMPFTGAHGFAGEIGFVKSMLTSGYDETLSQRVSTGLDGELALEAVKNNIKNRLNPKPAEFTTKMLLEEFENKNPVVLEEISGNAYKVGAVLKNLVILLDPDTIVISGLVRQFGDFYLNIIRNCLTENSKKKTRIVYSSMDDAIYLGLLDTAIKNALAIG